VEKQVVFSILKKRKRNNRCTRASAEEKKPKIYKQGIQKEKKKKEKKKKEKKKM